MKPVYTVKQIYAEVEQQKLFVTAVLLSQDGTETEGRLPARETAALLPREIIIGEGARASDNILTVMNELLQKLSTGRKVKIWEYQGNVYFSFLKWTTVRIGDYAA